MRSPLVLGVLALGVVFGAACKGTTNVARTTISSAELAGATGRARVPVNSRHEITFDAATGGLPPDEVPIDATFTTPAGKSINVGGFAAKGHFKVRYTPR